MVADTESSDSLPGSSNAASEMPANGSIHRKSQEKPPKKTHKAEREKLKRDQLNDLFVELGSMLDLDRQNTGKATVLGDAARVLRDLITQVESLRQEQSALVSERQYVSSEKNELQEENSSLKSQISELQTELCARMRSSSLSQTSIGMSDPATHQQMWSSIPHLSSVAMAARPASAASPLHGQEGYSADAGQAGYAPQPQPQPRELQLFPGASASSSPERERSSRLGSGQATPPSLTDSLPGQLCLSLLQPSQEASGGGGVVSRSREERRDG